MNNKLISNTVASFVFFFVNIIISLVVSPIIVEYVGGEAYGFVKIANDFATYATVVTVALNSVAARFISIKYHQNKIEEANKFFNSVFWTDVILASFLLFIGLIIIFFLEFIVNIPSSLVYDVKLLFLFIFTNFALSVISTIITVGTYIKNVLYISSIINAVSSIIKITVIFAMFFWCKPRIWILGFANIVYTIIVCVVNNYYRKKLIPDMKISVKSFSITCVIEMLKAGIWSSISSVSQILSDGLDLLITNIFLDSILMGQLALAKTVSSLMSSLISNLIGLFNPNLTYYYAKKMKEYVISEIVLGMKFTAFISCVPVIVFSVVGTEFFTLWVPSQNSREIFFMAELCIISVVISGITSVLNNVFVLTNHLKINSLVWLFVSVFDIILVFVLLKESNLGVFAVAGVSSIVGMLVNLIYLPCITGKLLECNPMIFYRVILRYIVSFIICIVIAFAIGQVMKSLPCNWIFLIIKSIIISLVLVIVEFNVFLKNEERKRFVAVVLKRTKA